MRTKVLVAALLLALPACQLPSVPVLAPSHTDALSHGSLPPPHAYLPAPSGPIEAPRDDDTPRKGAGHVYGDKLFVVDAHYGVPILQRAVFWDGNAEIYNLGLGASNYWFLSDWFAFRISLDANYFYQHGGQYAGEIESGGRFYVFDFDNWSAYWDMTGGFEYATDQVPVGGTYWNFTFSWGPGADIRLSENTDLLVGVTFHHMSNALGRTNGRNPSQNEGRFYVGFGWSW